MSGITTDVVCLALSLLTPRSDAVSHAVLLLQSDEHVVALRRTVREMALALDLSLVEQTKLVTATSELARNTIKYGGGGDVYVLELNDGMRCGVQLIFTDAGPGIADVERALMDGYTTGNGLGLGLSGARRLVDEFDIQTRVHGGTAVSIIKWA